MEDLNNYISKHKEDLIRILLDLLKLPSPDKGPTIAQEYVLNQLKELGFETETFRGIDERCYKLADYCEPSFSYDKGAYNVAGIKRSNGIRPSLLLFAHVDSEEEDYFGSDPYLIERKDGKIYGLGSADDKGGLAMIIGALSVLKALKKDDFDYDLTVLSILGKHGGAFGTLSAMMKGYTSQRGIYLHPAETGHGFAEIKNISLGMEDFELTVYGKPGKVHDDLDTGVSANILIMDFVKKLEEFNQQKRKERLFTFGSFKGEPAYILNIGSINSDYRYGSIAQKCKAMIRVRFFEPYTLSQIREELEEYLKENFKDVDYEFKHVNFQASPCYIPNDDDFVKLIENNITRATGIKEFIHQYHGGSDIRLPIIYGNCKCVGIGPYCVLPEKNSGEREWIDENDYLNGIKIICGILLDN